MKDYEPKKQEEWFQYQYTSAYFLTSKMKLPVRILAVRLSFGNPQFQITPCQDYIGNTLGKQWVSRKKLILCTDWASDILDAFLARFEDEGDKIAPASKE